MGCEEYLNKMTWAIQVRFEEERTKLVLLNKSKDFHIKNFETNGMYQSLDPKIIHGSFETFWIPRR